MNWSRLLGRERLILQSPLSRAAAVARLHQYVAPPTLSVFRLSSDPYLFSGEIRDDMFSLTEVVHFGKRNSSIQILGEVTETTTGSQISIDIRPLIPSVVGWMMLLVFGSIGFAWTAYHIYLGEFPITCLIIPGLLAGVIGVVMYSSLNDGVPAYATFEDHFRRIFMVTAPVKRLSR